MTNLSPTTLKEEGPEERSARERHTGVLGNGHLVNCHPTGEEEVVEKKSRVVCLTRPYQACNGCSHSKFKMVFNADPRAKLETVMCPRWSHDTSRMQGEQPTNYVETELLTCAEKPFPFCPSCPSLENLSKMFVDKKKDTWYARYKRFTQSEEADDE